MYSLQLQPHNVFSFCQIVLRVDSLFPGLLIQLKSHKLLSPPTTGALSIP